MHAKSYLLNQLNVLVTRPQTLANKLATLIEEEGGNALLYPVISIEDIDDSRDTLNHLANYDIGIFISPTAVRKTFQQLSALPSSLQVAAIGSSTAEVLSQHGVNISIEPDGHDSESLLQHERLQAETVGSKTIIIFRGVGGREHLANTLRERGATVDYAEVYRRARPTNVAPLSEQAISALDIITVTSNEGLQNLFDMNTHTNLLSQTPVMVPGNRSKQLAESLGFQTVVQAENATNAAYIDALKQWSSAQFKD